MYNRICIVGGPGSGKTTLSNILSEIYNIPVIHIDGIHHLANWKIRDKLERDNIILSYLEKDKWVIDGNYSSTIIERFKKAELIIWLDYSTFMLLKGVIKRFLKNVNKEREDIPGCKEKFDFKFLKQVLRYNKNKRHIILDNLATIPKDRVLIFNNQKDLNNWIKNLQNNN